MSLTTERPDEDARSALLKETVPLRHPGRTVAAVILLLLVLLLVKSMITNENYGWGTVGAYLFDARILSGVGTTLLLTVVAMTAGILLGIVLAAFRLSENKVLSVAAGAYLWFFRGTPLLIQLIFWFNLSALYPRLILGLPFGGPDLFNVSTNAVLNLYLVAFVALSLNEAAYMAEIVRGGLLSVPRQQTEAAKALGMGDFLAFRRVILPQALRIIVPPTGNQVIGMLKSTSLVSVIALADLLYTAQQIYANNFQNIPLLLVASFWYLLATTLLSYGQGHLERYYGRGTNFNTPAPKSPWRSMLRMPRPTGRRVTAAGSEQPH